MQPYSRKHKILKRLKRSLLFITSFLLGAILILWITGNGYLLKGIKETYLVGRTGPGIYDSIVFPLRTAKHANKSEQWPLREHHAKLSAEESSELAAIQTTSFLVIEKGEIILEEYFGEHTASTRSNTFSAAKSFIGLSIGIAKDKGFISSFDDTISNYLPFEIRGAEQVTIRHLLAMSSDLNWSESGANPFSDNAKAYYGNTLSDVMESTSFGEKPGKNFNYSSGNSQLLGYILKEATGMKPTDFVEKYIWSKISSQNDLSWSLDNEGGMEKAFCCIYATTRDYAKFGQLLLNEGKWGSETLIDSSTLAELTSPFSTETPQYGLHFWLLDDPEHPAFYARGILGQYIIVIPSLEMVVVRTGHQRKEKSARSKNDYKSLHPKDLFDYISIAKRLAKD
jgi:CubicO group peptidase (beta-lactamase class C family)